VFKSNEFAKKAYDDRAKIMDKLEFCDPLIKNLYEDLSSIKARLPVDEINKTLVLYAPLTSLKTNDKIPRKSERLDKIEDLVEAALKISSTEVID
jgi:hypothetical protein